MFGRSERERDGNDRGRVLLLTQYFPPEIGAPQTRLANVTRELVRLGYTVRVVTAMPNYPTGKVFRHYRFRVRYSETIEGATVSRTPIYPALGVGLRRLFSYTSFTLTCTFALAASPKPSFLLVESPPLFLAVPGFAYARFRRVPCVVNVADLWPDAAVAVGALTPGRALRFSLWLEQWVYRHASIVTTVTDEVAVELERKGVPRSKILLLPNGVDTEMFSPRPARHEVRSRLAIPVGRLLIYAGTMGMVHGLEPLVRAMGSVQPGVTLLLLGNGTDRPRLEALVAELCLTNVIFRDPIPARDLSELLSTATIGVVTAAEISLNAHSRPAKLFPLFAAGLPVLHAGPGMGAVATKRAGAGLAVHNDVTSIAAAIAEMLSDEARLAVWGTGGRTFVDPDWSWQVIVERWIQEVRRHLEVHEGVRP